MTAPLGKIEITPIAVVRSCYPEKFGVPRQPGLSRSAAARIEFVPPYNDPEAFKGLKEMSHIWVIFQFHLNAAQGWKPRVRPPRLGGNKSIGVFATRSPFRPNAIGLSVVRLIGIEHEQGKLSVHIEGGDFVDGTPVIDIKPYIPYTDAIEAQAGFAQDSPEQKLVVEYRLEAKKFLVENSLKYPGLSELITETLSLDPRPQYKPNTDDKVYGLSLFDLNIRFKIEDEVATVMTIEPK